MVVNLHIVFTYVQYRRLVLYQDFMNKISHIDVTEVLFFLFAVIYVSESFYVFCSSGIIMPLC